MKFEEWLKRNLNQRNSDHWSILPALALYVRRVENRFHLMSHHRVFREDISKEEVIPLMKCLGFSVDEESQTPKTPDPILRQQLWIDCFKVGFVEHGNYSDAADAANRSLKKFDEAFGAG